MLQYAAIRLKMKDGTYYYPTDRRPRFATSETIYLKPDTIYIKDTLVIRDTLTVRDTVFVRSTPITAATDEDDSNRKQLHIALKTNLLYDILLLPNLTAEIYLGRNWSLAVGGNWSWWTPGSLEQNYWYHRIQVAEVELRKWFWSSYPFHGHALGAYYMFGDYDIRFFPKDETSRGELSYGSQSFGLSYAYSFPIARRFNLEFGLAAGYVGGKYYKYDYGMKETQWEQQAAFNRRYIGPTRVGISLVWLPWAPNYNNTNTTD